jgi:hypothetical protein
MPDSSAQHPSWLDHEALELEATAGWRRQKANRYPVDIRNAKAVALLTRLANETPKLAGSRRAEVFEAFHDFIFNGSEVENPGTVIQLWSEAGHNAHVPRRGFNRRPFGIAGNRPVHLRQPV